MKVPHVLGVCVLLFCLAGATAHATLYDLTRITNNGTGLTFDPGDFTMDVSSYGNGALITFSNNCEFDSVVTAMYFLENDLLEFDGFAPPPVSSEGVAFSVVTKNANLPAGQPYGFDPKNTFAVDADSAAPKNGLNPGESLGLLFNLNVSYDTLIAAFDQQTLRAGIHVQSLPGGYSESFISTVPEPATLMLLGIGTMLVQRKRRDTAQ
jgi:hypothetical protein